MTEAKALRLAEQVLDALEIAHAHGVVHGAISPTNVLVTPRGSMRLCDFATPPGMAPRAEQDVLAARRAVRGRPPSAAPRRPTRRARWATSGASARASTSRSRTRSRRGDAETLTDLARTPARPLREVGPPA